LNAKTTIRKILFISVWLCIGGGMVTLLLAAISKKNKGQCKDYHITIKGAHNNFFIDQKDVEQILMNKTKSNIKGQPIASFNLHELEQVLEHSTWIDDAELYFDNQDILHVTVIEKEPVARIFTTEGNSFYIDSAGLKLPLSDKMSARVPMFTNFPDKKILSSKESLLLNDVRVTANFIMNDPFWMSQVAQIDITAERNFEMIPVIGNHLVKLGNGENIAQKFRRLMVFYKQVLSKTGFEKYKVIDVQYKGQVLASNYAGDTKVDSVRLRKNVEKLLQQVKNDQDDTEKIAIQVTGKYNIDVDSVSSPDTDLPIISPEKNNSPNPLKSSLTVPEEKIERKQKQPEKRIPKAVMPRKTVDEENKDNNGND
jgi:cell division protein FtsQ